MNNSLFGNLVLLEEIGKFQENWNGYGANPFSSELLAFVENIIRDLSVQPNIFPTARSSIQMEYLNGVGDYLEFEIFTDKTINLFLLPHNGEPSTQKNIFESMMKKQVQVFLGKR